MKRKILSIIGFVAFVVTMAYNINANINNDNEIDITLANTEALGRSEVGDLCGGCGTSCSGSACCQVSFGGGSWILYRC